MTVLETEEDNDEQQLNPPRKKLCLSLTLPERRNQGVGKNKTTPDNKMLNELPRLGSIHREHGYDVSSSTNVTTGCLRISTLCNLGNTCFLNSVLYTLRCTPSFLHNLHHLTTDLSIINERQLQTKVVVCFLITIILNAIKINNNFNR